MLVGSGTFGPPPGSPSPPGSVDLVVTFGLVGEVVGTLDPGHSYQ